MRYLEKYRKPLIKQYNIEAYRKAKAKKIENKQYDPADMIEGFGRYKDGFEVPQELIDLTLERAKEAKIQYTDSMLQVTMPVLRIQLKALLARDLWDMNEYFQIVNPSLEIYRQGLKAIKEE